MVEQWPYRSSLLIQLQEDYKQKQEITGPNGEEAHVDATCEDSMTFLEVYRAKKDLLSLPKDWQSLCSLDYDPEIFELFLEKRKDFTFEIISKFLKFTINLDFSLKETLALAIEQARISEKKLNNYDGYKESKLFRILSDAFEDERLKAS